MAATYPTTKAALHTGLLPTQERQRGRFAKASACGLVGFSTNQPVVLLFLCILLYALVAAITNKGFCRCFDYGF